MKLWAIYFEPEDWVAFRENRRFSASDRVESRFPSPFPFYGALRTALMKNWGIKLPYGKMAQLTTEEQEIIGDAQNAGKLRLFGPFIFEYDSPDGNTFRHYFPAPKNIYRVKIGNERTYKTMPLIKVDNQDKKFLCDDDLNLNCLPWIPEFEGAEEADESYIELKDLENLHCGMTFKLSKPKISVESRFGIGIEKGIKRAARHLLYTLTFYRFNRGGFFMLTEDEETVDLICKVRIEGVFLGSKQRWAKVYMKELEIAALDLSTSGENTAISLITPALLDGGIAPASGKVGQTEIVAIAGSKKVAVSGWDMVNSKPKPIYHAAGPGTVYYLKGIPSNESSLNSKLKDFGFGRFIFMKWECFKGEE